MKSKLIDTAELEQKLNNYLENPEEIPYLTVGAVKNMIKECEDKTPTNIVEHN